MLVNIELLSYCENGRLAVAARTPCEREWEPGRAAHTHRTEREMTEGWPTPCICMSGRASRTAPAHLAACPLDATAEPRDKARVNERESRIRRI